MKKSKQNHTTQLLIVLKQIGKILQLQFIHDNLLKCRQITSRDYRCVRQRCHIVKKDLFIEEIVLKI